MEPCPVTTTTDPTAGGLLPGPTGLDYLDAYQAMYPGLVADGIPLHKVQDGVLKVVDRAARLRRRERERVKEFVREQLLARVDPTELALQGQAYVADVMIEVLEEIR